MGKSTWDFEILILLIYDFLWLKELILMRAEYASVFSGFLVSG